MRGGPPWPSHSGGSSARVRPVVATPLSTAEASSGGVIRRVASAGSRLTGRSVFGPQGQARHPEQRGFLLHAARSRVITAPRGRRGPGRRNSQVAERGSGVQPRVAAEARPPSQRGAAPRVHRDDHVQLVRHPRAGARTQRGPPAAGSSTFGRPVAGVATTYLSGSPKARPGPAAVFEAIHGWPAACRSSGLPTRCTEPAGRPLHGPGGRSPPGEVTNSSAHSLVGQPPVDLLGQSSRRSCGRPAFHVRPAGPPSFRGRPAAAPTVEVDGRRRPRPAAGEFSVKLAFHAGQHLGRLPGRWLPEPTPQVSRPAGGRPSWTKEKTSDIRSS